MAGDNVTTAAKKWKNSKEDEDKAWGVSKVLQQKAIKEYIQDPLSKRNYNAAVKVLTVPKDNNVTISPLFYQSFSRIAQEPGALGKGAPFNLTGEMRNQILACPAFMTFLWAALKNQPAKSVSGDVTLVKLIEYTLRFHFGTNSGHVNLATIHGAFTFTVHYGVSAKAQHTVN